MPVLDEVAVLRNLFRLILCLIDDLRPRPAPAQAAEENYRSSPLPFMRQWIETGEENRP